MQHYHIYSIRFANGITALMRVTVELGSLTMPEILNVETGLWETQAFISQYEVLAEVHPYMPTAKTPVGIASSTTLLELDEAIEVSQMTPVFAVPDEDLADLAASMGEPFPVAGEPFPVTGDYEPVPGPGSILASLAGVVTRMRTR
jgi:hypothetical protein